MKSKKQWLPLFGAAVMAATLMVLPGAKEAKAAAAPEVSVSIGNVTAEIISVVRSAGRNVGHGGGNLLYVERSI